MIGKFESVDNCVTYVGRTRYFDNAVISVQESTGIVVVATSDRLCGHYRWNSIGEKTIWQFLEGLDRHYACNKLFPNQTTEFDFEQNADAFP